MSDLKPCPLCTETDVNVIMSVEAFLCCYAVACPDCGAQGPKVGWVSDAGVAEDLAKERWNDLPRRSDSDGLRKENARLREALDDLHRYAQVLRNACEAHYRMDPEWLRGASRAIDRASDVITDTAVASPKESA